MSRLKYPKRGVRPPSLVLESVLQVWNHASHISGTICSPQQQDLELPCNSSGYPLQPSRFPKHAIHAMNTESFVIAKDLSKIVVDDFNLPPAEFGEVTCTSEGCAKPEYVPLELEFLEDLIKKSCAYPSLLIRWKHKQRIYT
jgi:hypothetical protein